MARVNFSALIESITGKLAGSVFQDSYQGFQIRTRVSPRNPQSNYQQLRRGEFAFITQTWRLLTPDQRETWAAGAPQGISAINFFVSCVINLSLISVPNPISYHASPLPAAFSISIVTLGGGDFTITGISPNFTVPPDTRLLLQATPEQPPTHIFNNPSNFSPIITFPPGTNFSATQSISEYWKNHYGQFTQKKKICLKTNLINEISGLRGPDSITCAIENAPAPNRIIDNQNFYLVDSDGTFITFPN